MIKRNQLILGDKTLKDITDDICNPVETLPGKGWVGLFLTAKTMLIFYMITLGMVMAYGMGLLGVNHPIAWGTMIVTFVFWIGIGHAGTLISAILFLFRQKVANLGGQNSRSHDSFCGDDGRAFSTLTYGSSLVGFLAFSISKSEGSSLGEL
jgi:hypothetical protein